MPLYQGEARERRKEEGIEGQEEKEPRTVHTCSFGWCAGWENGPHRSMAAHLPVVGSFTAVWSSASVREPWARHTATEKDAGGSNQPANVCIQACGHQETLF